MERSTARPRAIAVVATVVWAGCGYTHRRCDPDASVAKPQCPAKELAFVEGAGLMELGPKFTGTSIAAGDLDGDGAADLVVGFAGAPSSPLRVLRGDGRGGFWRSGEYYAVAGGHGRLAMGDFNGDRALDVVAGNYEDAVVALLPGKGAGRLGTATLLSVGGNVWDIAAGDLDGDGLSDVAIGYSGGVRVALGSRDGLIARGDYGTGPSPRIAIGQMNCDSHPDLVAVDSQSSTAAVLLGRGDGSFDLVWQAGFHGWGLTSVATGDFDEDGRGDFVVEGVLVGDDILLGGDGTFRPAGNLPPARGLGSVYHMTRAELLCPGRSDLVFADPHRVAVQRGFGDGTFAPPAILPSAEGGSWNEQPFVVADLDGDARPDLASIGGMGLKILLNASQ